MKNQLDLHMHSDISIDGEYSPCQLMLLCKKNGLKTVALTDHNSIRGLERAKVAANKLEIKFIPGIELDCQYNGCNLHLLGYGIHSILEQFEQNERNILRQEKDVAMKRMQLVEELGIYFDKKKLLEHSLDGVVTGEMIAEFALHDVRNKDNYLMKPYRIGGERSDNPYVNFYWDFCSQGKTAYVPVQYIDLLQAIQIVKKAGGITVFAHPGANIGKDQEKLEDIIACGVDGIEVYSSYHDKDTIEFYNTQAERFHLLKTIGSDFHGKTKPTIRLGTIHSEEETKIYNKFMSRLGGAS